MRYLILFLFVTTANAQIWVLDSGYNPVPQITNVGKMESFDETYGEDCIGHGTYVTSLLARKLPDAYIISHKVSQNWGGCNTPTIYDSSRVRMSLYWLGLGQSRGDIVLWASSLGTGNCAGEINEELEEAVEFATSRGVIFVAASGNDNCHISNFSPTRMSQVLVIGATDSLSRRGTDILYSSKNQLGYKKDGSIHVSSTGGTSYAVPNAVADLHQACIDWEPYCTTHTVQEIVDGFKYLYRNNMLN